MKKKVKSTREWTPTGNDIQIRHTKYLGNGQELPLTLRLHVVSLSFQSPADDEWRGTWEGEEIWVKFTKPGWETAFSDNFPAEHKSAASDEVRRIERQFN